MAFIDRSDWSRGAGYTIPRQADELVEVSKRLGVRPAGCIDDASFAQHGHGAGSVADEFRRFGVHFAEARKRDRLSGWQRLRRMMAAAKPAGELMEEPALLVTRTASFTWATLPTLPRDTRRPENVDSSANDHGAECLRYAVGFERQRAVIHELRF